MAMLLLPWRFWPSSELLSGGKSNGSYVVWFPLRHVVLHQLESAIVLLLVSADACWAMWKIFYMGC